MGFLGLSLPGFLVLTSLVGFSAYIASQLDLAPEAHTPKEPRPLTGSLAENEGLEKAVRIAEGLRGPEAIVFHKGTLYTGLLDGRIVKMVDGKVTPVAHTGNPANCSSVKGEHLCGRPLGIRFGHKDDLYTADTYKGLLQINVSNGEVKTLFSTETPVNGRFVRFANDLDITKEGEIYMTDSSTKWLIKESMMELLELAPNGRILHYDPRTKKTSELVSGLYFPNGLQLSPKQDFLIVAESTTHRLMKYHLKGSKKGSMEVFADNLPGIPDNVRSNGRGGYWVGLIGTRLPGQVGGDLVAPYPLVRTVVARSIYLLQSFFATVGTIIPNQLCDSLEHWLPHIANAKYVVPKYGLAIELNERGDIIRSLHDKTGNTCFISHVEEHEGHVYLGSPWNNFIGKKLL